MNLSKDAIKLLRWLNQNDEWKYLSEIEKQYKKYDYRAFTALKTAKLIDLCVFEDEIPDYDEYGNHFYPEHYRISDAGKAFLEGRFSKLLPELRGWIDVFISLLSILGGALLSEPLWSAIDWISGLFT